MDTEEILKEFDKMLANALSWGITESAKARIVPFLRTHLTARYEQGRRDGILKALELVDENDPRKGIVTSDAYWGNTFRTALLATLSTKEEERI